MLSALLTACHDSDNNDSLDPGLAKIEEILNNQTSKPDFDEFLKAAQNGIWYLHEIFLFYTNGEMENRWWGGTPLHDMILRPDGECRIICYRSPGSSIPTLYVPITWNVSASQPNTIELYSETIEQEAETHHYDQVAARTTFELLYYKDGEFIMRGMQPFVYNCGSMFPGVYKDYSIVHGQIITDKETVEKYLAYEEYDSYREQHPEMFP